MLVVLIGIVYDIGKIEVYIFDKVDLILIIGIYYEYDLIGVCMIVRLFEVWVIFDEDC